MVFILDRLCCETLVVGPIQTNCYIVYHEDRKEAIVVDPGYEAQRIASFIKSHGLEVKGIFLTHGHFDHITEAAALRKQLQTKIYAARAEEKLLQDCDLNASIQFGKGISLSVDEFLEDGQEFSLLGETMRCILTPGHTSGGMCFYFPKALILLSGDTVFQGSVGRTDFPTGSMRQLMDSVRNRVLVLPEAVRIFPGHGPMTTVQDERMFNPYAG